MKRKRKGFLIRRIAVACIVLFGQLTVAGQNYDSLQNQIDELFSNYTIETPGVAVLINQDGKTIFNKGYGVANLEYGIPITGKTIFHIASVSKQFTAFALHLLEEDGLVSLEDDVRCYVPELQERETPIKLRHLIEHTSGLRDQFALLTMAGWSLSDVITTQHILDLLSKQEGLNFEPGTEFSYSNSGYTLVSVIVQRVTGKSLDEFCRERIFEPLQMHDTQFYDDYRKVVRNRAYSYVVEEEIYRKKKLNYSMVGATSLFTSAEDLEKWAANYTSMKVGNKALFEKFNAPTILNNGDRAIWRIIGNDTLYHAKGQFIRDYRGVEIFKHGGHDAGFRTFLARFPEKDLSIITLSNDEDYEIFARGLDIAEFVLGEELQPEEKLASTSPVQVAEEHKPFEISLQNFIGKYESYELSTQYEVLLQDGELVLHHYRLGMIPLERVGETEFRGVNRFYFSIDFQMEDAKATGFEASNFGIESIMFQKLDK